MRPWTDQTLDWYVRAGQISQYPWLVLEKVIPLARPGDVVHDIGSGPGLIALGLAPHVKRVVAIDSQRPALDKLTQLAAARGLGNISTVCQKWPQSPLTQADVSIAAFVGKEIIENEENLRRLATNSRRLVVLVAPDRGSPPPFAWPKGAKERGPEKLLALLEKQKITYGLESMLVDFGQPAADMAEAGRFLAWKLDIGPDAARRHAAKIARPRPGNGIYMPNPRRVALITIQT